MEICALVLAGGKSSRMNGKNKAFLKYKNMTFIENILDTLKDFNKIYISVDDKEKYNATLQMFFTINTVSVFLIHVFQGHVSGAMLPLVGAALAGTAVGTAVGMFLFRRLTMTGIKKVVYIFMMCAGSYLLLS